MKAMVKFATAVNKLSSEAGRAIFEYVTMIALIAIVTFAVNQFAVDKFPALGLQIAFFDVT